MTADAFDRTLSEMWHRNPFRPFTIELADGGKILVERPGAVAIRDGAAVYLTRKQYLRFNCETVKQIIEITDTFAVPK